MVTKLKKGTKVGQLGIWDGTQWVAGDPDCNIVKWGGTALTARDITTLLDHLNVDLSTRALEDGGNLAAILAKLDVALSTRARLQPWYQPNFLVSSQSYSAAAVAPHVATIRWTYTCPANRIAMVQSARCHVLRDGATANPGIARATVNVTNAICDARIIDGTVNAYRSEIIGVSAMTTAGGTITGVTSDASTLGTCNLLCNANIIEFNA
jgi:hypothetical protein